MSQNISDRIQYGNQQSVRRVRLMGMSLAGIALAGGGAMTWLLLGVMGMQSISWIALVLGVGSGLALIVTQLVGRTLPERVLIRREHRKRHKTGDAWTVAGPASLLGHSRPQGILAEMTWYEFTTANGQPFTLLYYPSSDTGAVLFSAEPTDKSSLDQKAIDVLVGHWAGTIVSAAQLYEPAQLTVVTESALVDGSEIQAESLGQRTRLQALATKESPLEDPGARQGRLERLAMINEHVEDLSRQISTDTPKIRMRFALSFCPNGRKSEDGKSGTDPESLGAAAAAAVPDMLHWLSGSGFRNVSTMAIADIAEQVRVAFDPATSALFDAARAQKDPIRLGWNDAGPTSAYAAVKHFEHEDWFSATMQMAGPAAHVFTEQAMSWIQRPDRGTGLRRVAQIYTLLPTEEAAAEADNAVERARTEANSKLKGPKSEDRHQRTVASVTADEIQAKGAVMNRYAMLATVTCETPGQLAEAKRNLTRDARSGPAVALRNTYRQTDTQFMLSLGLGQIPGRIATITDIVREAL